MFKHIRLAACALLICAAFAACSDEDDNAPVIEPQPIAGEAGFYVINQGNLYSSIAGSVDSYSFADGAYTSSVFYKANGQQLGGSPQKPVIYGTKMYIPMYGENLVWVVSTRDMTIETSVRVNEPEALCAESGYVFVAGNDGCVTRIDTTACNASEPLSVGPNPMGIVAANGKVYVSISNALSDPNDDSGKKLAVLDAQTFTQTGEIAVGVNPTQLVADSYGNVFVACQGDFTTSTPKVWKVDAATQKAAEFADGNIIATYSVRQARSLANYDQLYVINYGTMYSADYSSSESYYSSAVYETSSGEKLSDRVFADDSRPAAPIAIDVNPATGEAYVCSDASVYGFSLPGLVYVYDNTGNLVTTYNTGVHPYGVIFL